MGFGKLNDMRKTWYGHKSCNSHFLVDGATISIVDRPANKGKEEVKNENSAENKQKSLEEALGLTVSACTQ